MKMLKADYLKSINVYNDFLKESRNNIYAKVKIDESFKKVLIGFENWSFLNNKLDYSKRFIESFSYIEQYPYYVCKTHLTLLFEESEESGVDILESEEYSEKLLSFFKLCENNGIWDFWLKSRLLTLVNNILIGEELTKFFLNHLDKHFEKEEIDNTSLEYLKMYINDFLCSKDSFIKWITNLNYKNELLGGMIR